MPGLPAHDQLLESTQTQVHLVGDAIHPSHPLLSPLLPPAFNLSHFFIFSMKGRLLLSFVSLKSGTVLALLKRWSLDHIFPFCGSQNKIILVVVVQSLSCPTLHGLWSPARLLCAWDSPGKNAGVGCHFLLQGIFSTQRSNPGLLHCRQVLYWLRYEESPLLNM